MWGNLGEVFGYQLPSSKERKTELSAAVYESVLKKKPIVEFHVDIKAPHVVAPLSISDTASPVVAAVLGLFLDFFFALSIRAGTLSLHSKETKENEPISKYYDCFDLGLSDVQLVVTTNDRLNRSPTIAEAAEGQYFVEPFSISLDLQLCKLAASSLVRLRYVPCVQSSTFSISM